MFKFITSRLAGPIAGALALVLLAALAFVTIDKNATIRGLAANNRDLSTQNERLRIDLTQCRANRITLEEATRRQNDAVRTAQAAGEARVAELDRIAAEARRSAASAQERARVILARPGTGSACADAQALIRETIR